MGESGNAADGDNYQWAYSIMDSSRVSTFFISILLIIYGSFRSLALEEDKEGTGIPALRVPYFFSRCTEVAPVVDQLLFLLHLIAEKEKVEEVNGSPESQNQTKSGSSGVQTLDSLQAMCLPLGASISLLVMFFFFDSMQMLFASCTAVIATVALAFLLLPMCQYLMR